MPWRRLEDVFKTSSRRLEDVFRTSWIRLEDVLKTSWRRMTKENMLILMKTSWRRFEDVFWRRMSKANIFVLIKTSSEDEDERRLQDVFKTSSSRRMFAGSELGLYHQKLDGRVSSWVAKKLKTFSPVPISLKYFVKSCSYGHGFPIFLNFVERHVFVVLSL